MKNIYTRIATIFLCAMLLCSVIPSSTQTMAAGELKLAYQQGEVVEKLKLKPEENVDLRFLGAPDNWALLKPKWISTDATVAEVDSSGIVTAKAEGTTYILLVLDNGMTGLTCVIVEEEQTDPEVTVTPTLSVTEPTEENTEESSANTTDKTAGVKQVVLKNQEAIHIPSDATFSDGTPLQNLNDIARYAFSFMLTDGTPVVPTYDGNVTGVTDIAGVDCRKIEWASSIIVNSIYLMVYLDANNDGWVSATEKAEDALGYYYIKIDVDKTLTVEDWNIVK